MSKVYYGEQGYVELVKHVLENGVQVTDRTGVGSIAVFDAKVIYEPGDYAMSTIRPAGLKPAFYEMLMFLNGETNTKQLEKRGINFWKGNTSREFLDKRGLYRLLEGNMGKAYGYQWRMFNDQVDQLKEIYNTLKSDPYSRRMYTTLWNPAQSHEMALTPCWHSHQFVVLPDKDGSNVLHMKLLNRSLDVVFGFPFAVQQYRFYQAALAEMFGFKLGEMSCDLTHIHIYNNQIEYAKELVTREFGVPGKLMFKKPLTTLDDILTMSFDDIDIVGLEVNREPFKTPRPEMAV